MKPEYWIGIMALLFAVIGYAVSKWTGWFDAGIGSAVGILIGIVIYTSIRDRQTSAR